MRVRRFNRFHLGSKSSAEKRGPAGRESDSLLYEALVSIAACQEPTDNGVVSAVVEAGCINEIVSLAVEHRLGPVIAATLGEMGVEVPESLAEMVSRDRLVRLQALAALAKVAGVFDSAGVRWACLKGPAVASFMPHPELRRFNDLDLLVAGPDLGNAVDVLREAGIEEMNHNWSGYVKYRVGEIPMLAGAVNIDLHWHLVGLGVHRRGLRIDPVEMLSRARRRQVGQANVSILSAEDQLLHIAIHSAMSGANRLDQLRDMAVLVDGDSIDMDLLADISRRYRVATMVAQALDRARMVVDATVDKGWVDDLGGRSVSMRRWVDGLAAGVGPVGATLPVTMWRDGLAATAANTAWHLNSRLRDRLGRGVGWDVSDENGPLYFATRSGGAEKRAEFMAGAARWD